MILLDTNVISELFRPKPDSQVVDWMDDQPIETLYLTAVTMAELRAGLALMPPGRRRTILEAGIEEKFFPRFTGRVLPFDNHCTQAYAHLRAKARDLGVAISAADGYIAAVALTHHFAVATRDTTPFLAAGATVIDPFA